ncbi:MAG: TetR/AcrR family transcriptional regulator [Mycobacteriaceae bacterium]
MPSPRRETPVQRRSKQMVESITNATAQVLTEDGYAHLTTNRVAERAQVSIGSLYRYFANKNELIEALRDRSKSVITARLAAAIASSVTLEQSTGVRKVVAALVDALEDHQAIVSALINEVPLGAQSNILPDIERDLSHFGRLFLLHHRPDLDDAEVEARVYLAMGATLNNSIRIAIEKPPHLDRQHLIDLTAHMLTIGLDPHQSDSLPPPAAAAAAGDHPQTGDR